jgi:hypothetical protein
MTARVMLLLGVLAACGDDDGDGDADADAPDDGITCELTETLDDGTAAGHPAPLLSAAGEARAGRVTAEMLPSDPTGLLVWRAGDFVLANDKVAIVIEDVGDSDLYDPWGGRPVGIARVQGGMMVEPSPFGEVFLLTGRSSVVTEAVSIVADGSEPGAATIRARGKLSPTPFFESITVGVFPDTFTDIEVAIDYTLQPDSDHVDVSLTYLSPRVEETEVSAVLHAAMYADRMPTFIEGKGFESDFSSTPYIAFTATNATGWAYLPGTGELDTGISVSGFIGAFGDGFTVAGCGVTTHDHAKLVIGGPSTDNLLAAIARTRGVEQRTIMGTVGRGPAVVNNVNVHVVDATTGAYLTRARTNVNGMFVAHVPPDIDVELIAVTRGEPFGHLDVGATEIGPFTIELPAVGSMRVVVRDEHAASVPARIQVFPAPGQMVETVPANYGEPVLSGRLQTVFAVAGDVTLSVPPGSWRVVASRGYEYEIGESTVTIPSGDLVQVPLVVDHTVPSPAELCGDFHIHTWRSNDSGDDATEKVRQALADGLDLPVRSEHEWVDDFSAEIARLNAQRYMAAFGSVELTSFELWGHMGVFPLVADPSQRNNGAPQWQRFPTAAAPEVPFETLEPPAVFDMVRARAEQPLVIINHPRGGFNYFEYVGFDPATGMADNTGAWDTKFTLLEVFNSDDWQRKRESVVADWFSLLRGGRKVFAVGSSDSHRLSTTPVGYPRTCITLGTDDPRMVTASQVRDALGAGHSTINGGISVIARIAGQGPGDTTTGAGNPQQVAVIVRAPTWVDVDAFDVVVDGETVDTIPILPADADPADPATRWTGVVDIETAAAGSFVVVAAYGDSPLEPVHPGRIPFGVTNPIFVTP